MSLIQRITARIRRFLGIDWIQEARTIAEEEREKRRNIVEDIYRGGRRP